MGTRLGVAQTLPSLDQWFKQSIGPSEKRLDSKRSWKLGRLELVPHHQSIESQHQIVGDACTTVGDADP
ncbi:hypothetical protein D3C84_678660 [compost metagenome]